MRTSLLLLCAALLMGCDANEPGPPAPRFNTGVVQAGNAFTFRMLGEVSREAGTGNVFVSPVSASMALGMLMNGADGTTRAAMASALGLDGMPVDSANAAYNALLDWLPKADSKVRLTLANAVFARQEFPVEPDFVALSRNVFGAEAQALDFRSPSALTTINGWARTQTEGRIEKVLDRIADNEVMFVLNALYFKGAWRTRFDPSRTRPNTFQRPGGAVQAPTMFREGRVTAFSGDTFDAIDLPYGDSLFSMTVVLPRPGTSVDDVLASLTPARWDALVAGLAPLRFDMIGLPKLKLRATYQLKDPLTRLGMGVVFTDAADFTGLNRKGGLFLTFVKQDTFVEINEEGTEAAAVTTGGVGVTSVGPTFLVNRPYLLFLRERTSGAVLFAGRITDPTAAS